MVTEFIIPNHVTPSLNEVNKLHWRKRDKLRQKYQKYIMAYVRNQHLGKVRLEVYRHSPGTLDDDNFRGGCKQLIDALKLQKVIVDDSDQYIKEKFYEQVRIARGGPKMMVIKITDLV